MMRSVGWTLAMIVTVGPSQELSAQEPGSESPCAAAEEQAMAFWIGDWEVRNAETTRPTDPPDAHSSVSHVAGGCAVLERYENRFGYTGVSLNYYDDSSGTWRQLWVDNRDGVARLSGGPISNGDFRYTAGEQRGRAPSRVTWSSRDDGTLEQVIEESQDGVNWRAVVRLVYAPKS